MNPLYINVAIYANAFWLLPALFWCEISAQAQELLP